MMIILFTLEIRKIKDTTNLPDQKASNSYSRDLNPGTVVLQHMVLTTALFNRNPSRMKLQLSSRLKQMEAIIKGRLQTAEMALAERR